MTGINEPTNSECMRRLLSFVMPSVSAVGRRLWYGDDLREVYPRYLVATHGIIRASVPLMQRALEVARQNASAGDSVCGGLAAYLEKHIPEEMHHDEWLLEDLDRLGVGRACATDPPPSPTVASMVGRQYYLIHHVHPVALLGYIGFLEGYPPSEDLCEHGAASTGYPVEAFRTLRKHAHLDRFHCRELDQALDGLPLTAEQLNLVCANAVQSADQLCCVIEEFLPGTDRMPVGDAE